ncbi:hypothetical protein BDR07DRAFT_1375532 [Suillus spraguei]|nr:hypothetical protein BDR07DRAFT_1375532 [Suillus spraguei]
MDKSTAQAQYPIISSHEHTLNNYPTFALTRQQPPVQKKNIHHNKHQHPDMPHSPYEHQPQSLDRLQPNPGLEPSYAYGPQLQHNNPAVLPQPQYEDMYVHRDIGLTSYGVSQYMQWDLSAAKPPQTENAELQPQAVVNEQVLLVPTSTQAPNDVEEESSDSEDFQDNDGDPVELTRAEVLSIKERAKYELQHVMLQKEGVTPTRKKRARTVKKALRVGRIAVVGHIKYKPFETRKVKEEMVLWMSNTRHLFKDYAIHNIQKDLGLCLLIEQQGAKVQHKKTLVPTLLESLDFLHKFKYDDSGTLVCYVFKADWFMDMIVDVIYLNGLHQHLNAENFNAVFSLAGAAVFNTLSCFKKGVYKNINAFTEQFCDPYSRIVAMMQLIQCNNAKKERLMWLCNLIIAHGREILDLP